MAGFQKRTVLSPAVIKTRPSAAKVVLWTLALCRSRKLPSRCRVPAGKGSPKRSVRAAGSSFAGCACSSAGLGDEGAGTSKAAPTPAATARMQTAPRTIFTLPSSMDCNIARTRTEVCAASAPGDTAAAVTVEASKASDTAAGEAPSASVKPASKADSVRPRRRKRVPSRSRPPCRRRLSVAIDQPNRCAASSCVLPSRQQSTSGTRYLFGKRFNSSSSTRCASRSVTSAKGSSPRRSSVCRSRACRLAACRRWRTASRYAT